MPDNAHNHFRLKISDLGMGALGEGNKLPHPSPSHPNEPSLVGDLDAGERVGHPASKKLPGDICQLLANMGHRRAEAARLEETTPHLPTAGKYPALGACTPAKKLPHISNYWQIAAPGGRLHACKETTHICQLLANMGTRPSCARYASWVAEATLTCITHFSWAMRGGCRRSRLQV